MGVCSQRAQGRAHWGAYCGASSSSNLQAVVVIVNDGGGALTWGLFSVAIRLAMAADVALVVLNGVIVSNRGWWERWGNLPGSVDDGGSGWQWWRGWAVCGMQQEHDGCGGRKQSSDVAALEPRILDLGRRGPWDQQVVT